MAKVRIPDDAELSKILASRFKEAKDVADKLRPEFEACRSLYQGINEFSQGGLDTGLLTNALFQPKQSETEPVQIVGLDLTKAVFFLHSKLCVSEPVVTATPATQDQRDKSAAQCAQSYIPYFKKHAKVQEVLEAGPYLNTSVVGNGVYFLGWDEDGGEYPMDEIPEDADITTLDFKMEGDFEFRNVCPTRFFIDANATNGLEDANHCFEEIDMLYEKALFVFDDPVEQEKIRDAHTNRSTSFSIEDTKGTKPSTVKIYQYWEKGTPWNGFLGARVFFVNPETPKIIRRTNHPFRHKQLPYGILTDIDIPGNAYGMSRIVYAWQIQQCIDSLMSQVMDNIALHGSAKFMMPEGGVNEDGTNNDPASIGTYNPAAGGPPIQFKPASITADVWRGYEILRQMINNLYGMNEFSQGQIPRELSSYAVQLALEMDDKYRIRLFNKKKQFLKTLYHQALELTKQFVTEKRKLSITGVEGYSNDAYFSASELEGDYSIDVDYGQYIPVDPAARKQQLLEFIKSGFFEKAGGDMKKVAPLLVDGSMLDVKDIFEKATRLQRTEIDKIINGETVEVRKWDRHEAHAAAVDDYINSETFETLPDDIKEKIWQHGEAHTNALAEQLAKGKGGQAPQQGGMPGGPEGGPGLPVPPTPEEGLPPMPKPGTSPIEMVTPAGPIT